VLPGVPHVTGVRTKTGESISADLVVDTSGRRSALPDWLEDIGARRPAEELEDSPGLRDKTLEPGSGWRDEQPPGPTREQLLTLVSAP
jgi:hypothetical protein